MITLYEDTIMFYNIVKFVIWLQFCCVININFVKKINFLIFYPSPYQDANGVGEIVGLILDRYCAN